MGASTRDNTQPAKSALNGTVTARNGGVFFQEKNANTEYQIVAANAFSTYNRGMLRMVEWGLALADGSDVRWTQEISLNSIISDGLLQDALEALPRQRPAKKVEPRFSFGIDADEAKETLLRLGNGLGDTVFIQSCTQMSVSSTDDFEIRMFSVLYAEKRA